MFIFSASNSIQNLVVQIFSEIGYHNLGNIYLSFTYFVFALSSFVGAFFVAKIGGYKKSFIISSFGYFGFALYGYLISFCKNNRKFYCESNYVYPSALLFSGVNGLSAGIIWIS